jgi:septal ring factor EnvC (AmiA/AmiB activator)
VLGCLLVLLPIPPASAQAPSPTPAPTSVDLTALLQEQVSILEALDAIEQELAKREVEMNGLQDKRQRVSVALIDLEVRFEEATRDLVSTRDLIRKRLRAAQVAQRSERMDTALDPTTALEQSRLQRVLTHLLRDDQARIEAYRHQLEAWRRERDVLRTQRAELDAVESSVGGVLETLERERARRISILEKINADRQFYEKAHKDANKAYEALSEKVRKLEAWQDKALRFGSLRGQLRLPMSYARVATPFGPRRNAKLDTTTLQPGIEIVSEGSTTVRAVYWGRVAYVGWLLGYGNTVIVDHTEGFHSVYARLDKIEVAVGEVIESRQVVGTLSGTSALGTPGTLLFELREGGVAIDPAPWFR